ncbi:hypothetical protein AYI69_g9784 [Smittium culicis]|uniref:Uncharacterized protein n=1 Tax=Smittium culicis TaxID=133412 RepID=A0A1R1XAC7_9FUNG|nr:hypothetical protein AYI69_g9784 [Smittium culicis]
MLLITNYKTPVLLDMVEIKETGPFNTKLYTTNCELIGTFNTNVTHFNPRVGWIADSDLGGGYYDRTYYNLNEEKYYGVEKVYSDSSFKQPVTIVEVDMCDKIKKKKCAKKTA